MQGAKPGTTCADRATSAATMRLLTLALVGLLLALQGPLWFGRGGWLRVHALDADIAAQRQVNDGLRARNTALGAEVQDLKQGYDAIEERARSELGMVRRDETFFQTLAPSASPAAAAAAPAAEPSPLPPRR
jgi:cell division protein FtsB